MSRAFNAFMHEIIDYAGLFPPASLPLALAIENYAAYRREPEAWMLGRFIVAADRLPELIPLEENLARAGAHPARYVILAAGGATATESLARLRAHADIVADFTAATGGENRIAVVETRLPDDIAAVADSTAAADYLADFCGALAGTALAGSELFVEAPPPGGSDETRGDDAAVAALAAVAEMPATTAVVRRLGYKLRCGGVTPAAFPPCARVAHVLLACRDRGRPLKFTAGLHHPLRHRAAEPDVMMHGFLNVFGAGLLAHAHGLGADQTAAIVAETAAAAFRFTGDTFSWRELDLPAEDVRSLRTQYLVGFGSCSFDEPREDLVRLKLSD